MDELIISPTTMSRDQVLSSPLLLNAEAKFASATKSQQRNECLGLAPFCLHFCALMRKNIIVKKRKCCVLCCECLSPILFVGMFCMVRFLSFSVLHGAFSVVFCRVSTLARPTLCHGDTHTTSGYYNLAHRVYFCCVSGLLCVQGRHAQVTLWHGKLPGYAGRDELRSAANAAGRAHGACVGKGHGA